MKKLKLTLILSFLLNIVFAESFSYEEVGRGYCSYSEPTDAKQANMVICLDVSGSMNNEKTRKAFMLIGQIGQILQKPFQDGQNAVWMGIVLFSGDASVYLPIGPHTWQEVLLSLDSLRCEPSGGTSYRSGLKQGYAQLYTATTARPYARNYMFIVGDGDDCCPVPATKYADTLHVDEYVRPYIASLHTTSNPISPDEYSINVYTEKTEHRTSQIKKEKSFLIDISSNYIDLQLKKNELNLPNNISVHYQQIGEEVICKESFLSMILMEAGYRN